MKRNTDIVTILFGLSLGLFPHSANGIISANPAPALKSGSFTLGVGVSNQSYPVQEAIHLITESGTIDVDFDEKERFYREVLQFGYAITENIVVAGSVGSVKLKTGSSVLSDEDLIGKEFSVNYRHRFQTRYDNFSTGLVLDYTSGNLSNKFWEGEYSEFVIGYGMAKRASTDTFFYGTFVYHQLNAEFDLNDKTVAEVSAFLGLTVTSYKVVLTEDAKIGGIIGIETQVGDGFMIAVGMYFLYSTGYSITALYGF